MPWLYYRYKQLNICLGEPAKKPFHTQNTQILPASAKLGNKFEELGDRG